MRIIPSANPRPLNLLAVGPGGLIAAASNTFGARGIAEVWDGTSGTRAFTHPTKRREVGALAFLTDRLLIGERWGVFVSFSLANWARTPAPRIEPVHALASSGDLLLGTSLAAGASASSAAECFAIEPGLTFRSLWRVGPHNAIGYGSPAVTPTADRCAMTLNGESFVGRPTQLISLRDADTGREFATIPTDAASPVQQLAFTADGATLLARTDSRAVTLYDAATGAPSGELVHRGRPYVTGIAAHPRGPVACARSDGTATLWDAGRREQLRVLDWKAGRLVSVAFSPDGLLGAAGTEDGKVVVWDVDL